MEIRSGAWLRDEACNGNGGISQLIAPREELPLGASLPGASSDNLRTGKFKPKLASPAQPISPENQDIRQQLTSQSLLRTLDNLSQTHMVELLKETNNKGWLAESLVYNQNADRIHSLTVVNLAVLQMIHVIRNRVWRNYSGAAATRISFKSLMPHLANDYRVERVANSLLYQGGEAICTFK